MRKVAILASICIVALPIGLSVVGAEGQGIIEGQVVNATPDAAPESLAGLEVRLYVLAADTEELAGSTVTDQDGRFRFDGLGTDIDLTYRFELQYEGITYDGQGTFPAKEAILRVVATIYETTENDEAIEVQRHHTIVDFGADTLTVKEMYVFNNTADTIYVGDEGLTLRFALPADATNLSLADPQSELNTMETDKGFASLLPVAPGQTQVLFSYTLPYDDSHHALVRRILYPTTTFDLMIPDVGVQVRSEDLSYLGLTGGEETSYLHFQGQDLTPQSQIEIRFSGAPQTAGQPVLATSPPRFGLEDVSRWIALGLALLGGALALLQVYFRNRSPEVRKGTPSAGTTPSPAHPDLGAERQELLQLIADLDDAFSQGQIARDAYQQLRTNMKRRLVNMGPESKATGAESNSRHPE